MEAGRITVNGHSLDLSDRQVTVLKKVALCQHNKEIADELHLSVKTIEFHVSELQKKLGVNGRDELIRLAFEQGVVTKGERAMRDAKLILRTPEVEIKTSNDLTDALMQAATNAANGKADPVQVNSLCQVTNTMINFARLQMDVIYRQGGRIPKWLTNGSIEVNPKPK